MADDWQAGDLALCVKNGGTGGVRKGGVYTVTAVLMAPTGHLALALAECRSACWQGTYAAFGFRKIKPLTGVERDEFTADLRIREPVA
jgi:hypothetical protein